MWTLFFVPNFYGNNVRIFIWLDSSQFDFMTTNRYATFHNMNIKVKKNK